MAIVKEFHGSRGGTVYFDDSYFRTLTPEQVRKNQEELLETAREIGMKIAVEKLKQQRKEASDPA